MSKQSPRSSWQIQKYDLVRLMEPVAASGFVRWRTMGPLLRQGIMPALDEVGAILAISGWADLASKAKAWRNRRAQPLRIAGNKVQADRISKRRLDTVSAVVSTRQRE